MLNDNYVLLPEEDPKKATTEEKKPVDLKDFDGTTPERTMSLKKALLLLEERIKDLEERVKDLEL